MEDRPHPGRVAAGQVIVDGYDVDAKAGKGVQVGGQGGHQSLALSGFHLGDLAFMKDHAANQLDVIVSLSQVSPRRFPHHCERFGEQIVQSFPAR